MSYPGYKSIHGRELGLTPRGLKARGRYLVPAIDQGGNTYYVNSAASNASNNNDGRSVDYPLATLDGAIGKCTANQGDRIVLLANHAETIAGASGITADIAGISVIGLGTYNQRPRFLMDGGTSVSFVVSAADFSIENCVFASGHSGVVLCFDVTAVGATFIDVEFVNNTTNENFLTPIKATGTTDNEANGLKIVGCRWLTTDADDLEFVEINANLDGLVFQHNYINTAGTACAGILCAGTKVLSGALITHNFVQSAATSGDLFIDNGGSTGQTGFVAYNLIGNLDTSGAQVLGVATGLQFFENYMTSTSTESGGLQLTADTPNS